VCGAGAPFYAIHNIHFIPEIKDKADNAYAQNTSIENISGDSSFVIRERPITLPIQSSVLVINLASKNSKYDKMNQNIIEKKYESECFLIMQRAIKEDMSKMKITTNFLVLCLSSIPLDVPSLNLI
jgi:hypothetical protein